MLPGFPAPLRGRKISYADAIAAISDKTIYCRTDTSTAADNASLNTTSWDNEAISTPDTGGNAVWKTGVLNGQRGVLSNNSGTSASVGRTLQDIIGSDKSFTLICVEKRSGTQGANSGNNRRFNSQVITSSGSGWGVTFATSSRDFMFFANNGGTFTFNALGASFADGVPYVLSVQIDNSGSIRTTMNGVVMTSSGLASDAPGAMSDTVALLSTSVNSSPNYGFEYIVSSTRQADATVDAAVAALMKKWSIS